MSIVDLHTITVYYHYIAYMLELGGTQIVETVQYFIKYHGINNYHGI